MIINVLIIIIIITIIIIIITLSCGTPYSNKTGGDLELEAMTI